MEELKAEGAQKMSAKPYRRIESGFDKWKIVKNKNYLNQNELFPMYLLSHQSEIRNY